MKKIFNSKKRIIIVSIISLIVLSFVGYIFYNKIMDEKNKLKIVLKDNRKVEINTKVKKLSFIKKIEHGKIKTKNKNINTKKLGKQKITLIIENYKKQEIKYNFNIKVSDTIAPIIEFKDKLQVIVGNDIDLLKDVKVTDNSKEKIKAKVEGDYDLKKVGTYQLKYVVEDSSHNKTIKVFQVIVEEMPQQEASYTPSNQDNSFTTRKGFSGVTRGGVTYINGILIANKTYSLPSTYGNGLTGETLNAFNSMKNDAANNGISIYIASGFRPYSTQKVLYDRYGARDGYVAADTYSARPGHSEHQTGLGLDLNTINDSSDNSGTTNWVLSNCYRYGFVLRYPNGKTYETGYMYEWWHLRYVGNDLALKLYNGGNWITLENYFGITSQY